MSEEGRSPAERREALMRELSDGPILVQGRGPEGAGPGNRAVRELEVVVRGARRIRGHPKTVRKHAARSRVRQTPQRGRNDV